MKRVISTLIILVGLTTSLFFGAQITHAAASVDSIKLVCENPRAVERPKVCDDNSSSSTENPLYGPNGVLTKVINIMAIIFGVISVFVIIISGLRMVMSSGDSNSVATARRSLLFALIALATALSARILVAFVLSRLE